MERGIKLKRFLWIKDETFFSRGKMHRKEQVQGKFMFVLSAVCLLHSHTHSKNPPPTHKHRPLPPPASPQPFSPSYHRHPRFCYKTDRHFLLFILSSSPKLSLADTTPFCVVDQDIAVDSNS